jgi:hypothetical protein
VTVEGVTELVTGASAWVAVPAEEVTVEGMTELATGARALVAVDTTGATAPVAGVST